MYGFSIRIKMQTKDFSLVEFGNAWMEKNFLACHGIISSLYQNPRTTCKTPSLTPELFVRRIFGS